MITHQPKENIVKKEIKGFKKHWIRSDGYVEHIYNGRKRITKGVQHRDGFFRVILCDGRIDKSKKHNLNLEIVSLPHLVATYFVPNPNNYTKIKHLDKDYSNNSPTNLEWVSDEEWDSMRRCYNGEVMYEIPKAPHYYITKSGVMLSAKENSLDELEPNFNGSFGFVYDGKVTTWKTERILKAAHMGEFSKKEHDKWLRDVEEESNRIEGEREHQWVKVVHLPTLSVYDSMKEAEESSSMSAGNISMHCRNKVKRPRWAHLDSVDLDELEPWKRAVGKTALEFESGYTREKPFRYIPTGEIYYSKKIAANQSDDKLSVIYAHLKNSVEEPRWEWVEDE